MITHRVTFTLAGKLGATRVRNFNEQLADATCLRLTHQGASMPNADVKIGSSFIWKIYANQLFLALCN